MSGSRQRGSVRARLRAALATAVVLAAYGGGLAPGVASAGPPGATGVPRAGDPVRGAGVYQACQGCHDLDEDDVGPRHRAVVGRRAGSVPGYAYSPALRQSGVVFTPEVLDRWLADPQSVVPGTKMFFALKDARDRADVIAYLATQR